MFLVRHPWLLCGIGASLLLGYANPRVGVVLLSMFALPLFDLATHEAHFARLRSPNGFRQQLPAPAALHPDQSVWVVRAFTLVGSICSRPTTPQPHSTLPSLGAKAGVGPSGLSCFDLGLAQTFLTQLPHNRLQGLPAWALIQLRTTQHGVLSRQIEAAWLRFQLQAEAGASWTTSVAPTGSLLISQGSRKLPQ